MGIIINCKVISFFNLTFYTETIPLRLTSYR